MSKNDAINGKENKQTLIEKAANLCSWQGVSFINSNKSLFFDTVVVYNKHILYTHSIDIQIDSIYFYSRQIRINLHFSFDQNQNQKPKLKPPPTTKNHLPIGFN